MWPLGRADALRPQARGFPVLWPLIAPRRQPGSRPPLRHRPRAERPHTQAPGGAAATYQEEHPLLQALPGELVQAALADELLQDSDGVPRGGPGATRPMAAGGPAGVTIAAYTSLSPSAGALAGPAQMPTHPLACTLLPPACSFRPAGAGWVPADSVPRLSAERLWPRLATGGCAEGSHANGMFSLRSSWGRQPGG